jgi:integrase
MPSNSRRIPGLLLRGAVWHIDKVIYGKRICESTGTKDLTEALALLAHRVTQARRVHHDTLTPYIRSRLANGLSPGTINRDLAVVIRILNLASRLWRDETDRPWLPIAPLIPMQRHPHRREPYPLSVAEQRLLFSELATHLASMALFKVNTGLREQEVLNLRWQWEVQIPELGTSIFVIPRDYVKNELDRYVVLNRIARSVVDECRGRHSEFVFSHKGNPLTRIYNSGWKGARRRASARYEKEFGRPCPAGFRSIRVHDLKHTWGHRLRVAGVSFAKLPAMSCHLWQSNAFPCH